MLQSFKGKLKNTGEWIEGSRFILFGRFYIVPEDGDPYNISKYEVDEKSICESTELYNHGTDPLWEHDYVRIADDDHIYEIRKEYDCPGGGWSQSGFILKDVGWSGFLSFEDTIDDYSNEICVEVVGNSIDNKEEDILKKYRAEIEFISYTGKYPNLCAGVLTVKINDETVTFGSDEGCQYPRFWRSGGSVDFFTEEIRYGMWELLWRELPEKYRMNGIDQKLIDLFNRNVDCGCCGGCI